MTRTFLFDANGDDRILSKDEKLRAIPDDQLLWVQSDGKNRDYCEAIPSTDNEDALIAKADPVAVGSDIFALRSQAFSATAGDKGVIFLVGRNWLVSFAESAEPIFDEFIKADTGKGLKGHLTGTGLLVSLLLTSFEAYQQKLAAIDDAVDKLDERILRTRKSRRILSQLAELRTNSAMLRRRFVHNRSVVRALARPDFGEMFNDLDKDNIAHLSGAFDRVEDQISSARDEILGSFDLYATKVTQDTNELLKVLTIVSVTTGLIGAIAGIMGMNTYVPMKDSGPFGFYVVLGVMVVIVISILVIARVRRWL